MTNMNTLRPGVFSEYTVTSMYRKAGSGKTAALLCQFPFEGELWFSSYNQAAAVVPVGSALYCLRVLFGAGVGKVLCVPYAPGAAANELTAALERLQGQEVYALVADIGAEQLVTAKNVVEKLAAAQQEMLMFCGIDDPSAAQSCAKELGSERVVLACPGALPKGVEGAQPLGVYSACALAGMVLGSADPAANFSGYILDTLEQPSRRLTAAQIEELLGAGVTPIESVGGNVQCVRALTTRTATGGLADRSFAPVGTVLVIDDVIVSVRQMLRSRLKGIKNTPQSLAAVASQVTVLLQEKLEAGIITSYEPPVAVQLEADPTVCVVELAFHVAFAVNQILIKAHITV